jgi:serine/threonine protein kinase
MSQGLVNHPNIVQVLDAGLSDDGIAYIAMELLEGRPLAEELAGERSLPAPRAAWIMAQVCRALAAAHALGIIHRDVKPENIFLHAGAPGEVAKLLDFGVAKVQEVPRERRANLTVSGVLLGTPLYMAPERFLSDACDATADVYSVGVMMYRALAGRAPFEGNLTEIMMHAVSGSPRPLREIAREVDPALESIVMRALSQEPRQRPSAAELAEVLERFSVGSTAPASRGEARSAGS